ncbi:hypothetical protein MKW94_008993 [Papaver nudicaule]|uniref:Uncharacterized protein n=1 Tax=Papaver nudicaule TaxID=74823 RepID=A0AA41VTX8_PAPNU|nr:hypothetical protein [Papaver nudicaule]MCL7047342.1 hypothetical protein [Papaver nudicaule]
MAKISIFFCFLLFVLIAMPTSSSSTRMILEDVKAVKKCPQPNCALVRCKQPAMCLQVVLECPNYTPCCGCPTCC